MRCFIIILLFFPMLLLAGNRRELNIYNWSGYIPSEVLTRFTKETGIKINYSTFNSNQQLYTKLKADPNIDFDLVVPSNYVVGRMAKEHMLIRLDKSKLSNMKNLEPGLLNRSFDPHNRYTLPYLWGTTSIILNRKYYNANAVMSWDDLWHPRFKNSLAMTDSARDGFAVAFLTLGYSINDENPAHIREAYLKLRSLLPNVLNFTGDGSQQLFVNEDANIGMIESGDALAVIQENPNFVYRYPKEGAIVWIDNMAIPKGAQHIAEAYRFINFVMRPDIAKMISLGVGFATPNRAAKQLMGPDIRKNPVLYPSADVIKKGHIESAISNKANALYLKYWELLKLVG